MTLLWKQLRLLPWLSCAMTLATPRKRVAIIGAGAGGLVAAKVMREDLDVVVYEQHESVGGIWRRGGDVVYDGLRCNLPHQTMAFKGFPFVESETRGRSFVDTRAVTAYLERFGADVDVRFGKKVASVRRRKKSSGSSGKQWEIAFAANDEDPEVFDFVVVANGHYEKAATLGSSLYEESVRVSHSRDYQNPAKYAGKTVVLVGARSSGTDLAKELAFEGAAAKVVVADKNCRQYKTFFGQKLAHAPPIVEVRKDKSVLFLDGTVEPAVDEIISCVGFDYAFPFLEGSGVITTRGRVVEPLWNHLFLVDEQDSTIAFLGLPHSVVPFPLMQAQALAANAVFAGRATLPASEERRLDFQKHKDALPRPKDAHHLGDAQWDYCKQLVRLAADDDDLATTTTTTNVDLVDGWDRFVDTNRAIYNHVGPRRPAIPGAPDVYRDLQYEADHDAGSWRCLNEDTIDDRLRTLYIDAVRTTTKKNHDEGHQQQHELKQEDAEECASSTTTKKTG
mmetsp:Transcript_20328/g.65485  ORF Transcript_20328/g.65485 Transcript_20328/m.65485 type:complete len:507 (+) Transcript_20328:40-1560(+)